MSEEKKETVVVDKENSNIKHVEPYTQQFGTMIPSATQKFMRTCVVWQFFRFIAINLKMTILILKSHH
ncbi:MAG: hypothetical protein JJW00_00800 [Sulfurimonas sp.]|nr:hypothetical protein [Sulfurimonas sp.]